MKRRIAVVSGLLACLFVTSCFESAPKTDFPTGDPMITYHNNDRDVTPETAKKLLDLVLGAAPQLKSLRVTQAASAGDRVTLNLAVQSSPDPKGMHELYREYYFVYVNTNGPQGLITTATFVVKADFSEVKVFDDGGDDVVPVADWLTSKGIK
ncbi:MAG: hypothetical protein K8T90_19000 [Planctomycetes bacterium]|nr:hypothetical protein [Planctomycetota bacterium]